MEMTTHKRYRFLSGPDDAEFCQRVSEALAQGHQLYCKSGFGDRRGSAYCWPGCNLDGHRKAKAVRTAFAY